MKTLATLALAAFVLVGGLAQAQDQYDVGLFADPAGQLSTAAPAPGAPFNVYAVATGLDGQVKAFELSMNGLLETGAFIVGNVIAGPAPLNVVDSGTLNYIAGTGACIEGEPSIVLVTVSALPLAPFAADTAVCVGGTNPSSFGGAPGYAKCDDQIVPFGVAQSGEDRYPDGCLILNATLAGPVPNESVSFGDMKARF